jgi:uncharacterized protein (TIGR00369 family)
MKEIAKYSGCFICGDKNKIGLNAKFYFENDKAYTEYYVEKKYEGYYGVFHGGITSALLDEVMIKSLLARGIFAMTVEITVRFKKAVYTGDRLKLEGYMVSEKGRLYKTEGFVKNQNGDIVASATGKYLRVNENMKKKLTLSLSK